MNVPSATDARASESILGASKEALSSSLALLSELSLFNLLLLKSADWFDSAKNLVTKQSWSSDFDHFAQQLQAETEKCSKVSDGECLIRVIGELEELMEVTPRDLRTRYDLAETVDDLCMASVRMLQADKSAKFTGSTATDLMEYQIGKAFAGLKVSVANLCGVQQEQVVTGIHDFIAKLPTDQQKFILNQLGASELTESVIRTAMINGTLWTAFTVAVQVFGFAFYMAAAQLLALVSFHLLPFGAYIGLSSLIAVLSSPWMLPVFLVVGGWLYSYQNTGLRKSVVPMILVTLWISGMEMEHRLPIGNPARTVEEALRLWSDARDSRDRDRRNAQEAKTRMDRAKASLDQTSSELDSATSRKDKAETRIEGLRKSLSKEIVSAVRVIAIGSWGLADQDAAVRVVSAEDRIIEAEASRDSVDGWLGRAWEEVKYWTGDYLKFNSDLKQARQRLVSQISNRPISETESYPSRVVSIFRGIEEQRSRVIEAHQAIDTLQSVKSRQEGELGLARQEFYTADSVRKQSEKRYYGLEMV